MATISALRATRFTAWAVDQTMSTLLAQECHLLLKLAEMQDADKVCFLDGLFSNTVTDFGQQFSAVQKQTEAIKHILPPCDTTATRPLRGGPQSARHQWCPPVAYTLTPARPDATPWSQCRAHRRKVMQYIPQAASKPSKHPLKQP